MTLNDLCARLLPADPALHGETLGLDADHLTITAALSTSTAVCPTCGQLAHRIHSDYTRTLADLSWAALPVEYPRPCTPLPLRDTGVSAPDLYGTARHRCGTVGAHDHPTY